MDKPISLAEIELARIDWSKLRDIRSSFGERTVSADYVPAVMKALLNAKSPEEATEQYNKIEGYVFLPDQLFESAEYLVPVLIASLLEVPEGYLKTTVLELLFWIISADGPDRNEVALGNVDLLEKCRAKAREGLWIFYRELSSIHREAAFEILKKIETDHSRLEAFLRIKNLKSEI